jgi:hypothetical protein
MKRLILAAALACALSATAIAGEIPTGGAPVPGEIPSTGASIAGEIPSGGAPVSGEIPTTGASEAGPSASYSVMTAILTLLGIVV